MFLLFFFSSFVHSIDFVKKNIKLTCVYQIDWFLFSMHLNCKQKKIITFWLTISLIENDSIYVFLVYFCFVFVFSLFLYAYMSKEIRVVYVLYVNNFFFFGILDQTQIIHYLHRHTHTYTNKILTYLIMNWFVDELFDVIYDIWIELVDNEYKYIMK